MAQKNLKARLGVRARPWQFVSLSVMVAITGLGCSSRRASMRPVYLAPAPVVVPAPSSAVMVPSAPVGVPQPPMVVPPTVESYGPGADMPAAASPSSNSPPPLSKPFVPSAEPGDEPGLNPVDPNSSRVPTKSSSGKPIPGTSSNSPPPSARLDGGGGGRRFTAATTKKTTSLQVQVQPFVKDAADLFNPPKADRPWKYIVLHHSATEEGGYDSIDHEHRKRLGWAGCGYHFVIGNGTESEDGGIEVAQRWRDQKLGVHCRDGKNPDINEYGIGICLVGDLEKNPPTARQIAAAKALVSYLEARYKIPAERTETHAHLAASPTSCPGRMFPTEAILGNAGLANR